MPSSNRKTRERQLSKLAARRANERRRQQRQRLMAGVIGAVVTAAALTVVYFAFLKSDETPAAAPTHTPTASAATPTPTPTATGLAATCGYAASSAATGADGAVPPPDKLVIVKKKTYTAVVKTSLGTFQMELFDDQAPCTVNSFVYLAQKGFFDGLTFHRISQNPDVIQGGDPTGTGSGGPGYTFNDELDNNLKYEIGTLAMANSGPNTNGSQWFIVTGESGTTLPKSYTIFGKVTQGMSVVMKINDVPVKGGQGADAEQPVTPVTIDKITIQVSNKQS
jgi:cyclophilin family peptidyl-prolyl cis-trans isomerase